MNTQAVTERLESRIDTEAAKGMALRPLTGGSAFIPASMGEVMEFAKMMAVARIGVRKHLRNNPGACAAIIMQAARWEMDPYAVANKSYEVNDQIAYESQLIVAVLNTRAPIKGRIKYEYEGEGNSRRCRAYAVLAEDDERVELQSPTMASISPKNSPLWKSDPDQQLSYYTGRLLARRYFPEVLLGVYDIDEIAPVPLAQGPDGTYRPVDAPPRPTRNATRETLADIEQEKSAVDVAETITLTTVDGDEAHFDLPGEASNLRTAFEQEMGAAEARGVLAEFFDYNGRAAEALEIERPAPDESEAKPTANAPTGMDAGNFLDRLNDLDAKAKERTPELNVFLASRGVQADFARMNDDQKAEWNKAVAEALGDRAVAE